MFILEAIAKDMANLILGGTCSGLSPKGKKGQQRPVRVAISY